VLAEALTKSSQLILVMLGDVLSLSSENVFKSWGARKVQLYQCPLGHCQLSQWGFGRPRLFQTVFQSPWPWTNRHRL
jgi:hypothetical protein